METFEYTMTTDPTPHTERAAAAAAEIYHVLGDNGPAINTVAAIIAKHFNDDAAKLAEAEKRIAQFEETCEEACRMAGLDASEHGDSAPLAIAQHARGDLAEQLVEVSAQHDALRLAAGRALELLKAVHNELQGLAMGEYGNISMACDYAPSIVDVPDAITALSAALAGEQMGKE